MTYVDPDAQAPAYRRAMPMAAPPGGFPSYDLPIEGQGTIGVVLGRIKPFSITARSSLDGAPALRWRIERGHATLELVPVVGRPARLARFEKVGLDPAPNCSYWFSFDSHNRLIRFGKGEMRLGTMLASHSLARVKAGEDDPWKWLSTLKTVEVDAELNGGADLWRDPVTIELPMRVVPHDAMTMEDVAWGRVTVPGSLTPTCQKLYDNVAGARFLLDTPDFPEFSAAIKASIEDPKGWCSKVLESKATEFGKRDPDKTYLRITLGTNQGESPGVPYVMEIWPSGHYSPIHNHGGADAVIRVLHGEITVELYPMLSPEHKTPFAVKTFVREDVTWISARLNQVHRLVNHGTEPCITIQCYLYAEENRVHHPYFDYLEGDDVRLFDPNSDADFLRFKQLMKAEWSGR